MSTQTVSHQHYIPPFSSTPCIAVESYSDQDNGYACGEPSAICPKCGDNAEVCSKHLINGLCIECAE